MKKGRETDRHRDRETEYLKRAERQAERLSDAEKDGNKEGQGEKNTNDKKLERQEEKPFNFRNVIDYFTRMSTLLSF